jgi:hypothetical protein
MQEVHISIRSLFVFKENMNTQNVKRAPTRLTSGNTPQAKNTKWATKFKPAVMATKRFRAENEPGQWSSDSLPDLMALLKCPPMLLAHTRPTLLRPVGVGRTNAKRTRSSWSASNTKQTKTTGNLNKGKRENKIENYYRNYSNYRKLFLCC